MVSNVNNTNGIFVASNPDIGGGGGGNNPFGGGGGGGAPMNSQDVMKMLINEAS